MLVELKVPVLPESVTEGTLGEWHKKIGDAVAVDEIVVDLETDKVVLEIVATSAGVLESIAYETGDTVKNDDILGVIILVIARYFGSHGLRILSVSFSLVV